MSVTRPNPAPRPDRTLHCIGDVHFGADPKPQFSVPRQQVVSADCALPTVPQVPQRVQLGDLTDTATTTQDADGLAWVASLGGEPHYVIGNHDMYGGRSADACATAWGLPGKSYVVDLGYADLVVVGPDELHPTNLTGLRYSTTALDFLDAALRSSTKPCLIAAHAPLYGTVGVGNGSDQYRSTDQYFYAANDVDYTTDAGIRAVLAEHDNAKAWISGHTHSPAWANDIVKAETVGSHTMAMVNTSCLAYTGKVKTDVTPLVTMFVTTEDDRVEVRFRDHGAHQWVGGGPLGGLVHTVTY